MNEKKLHKWLVSNCPEHMQKSDWKKLIKSALIQPDPRFEWSRNDNTGEWIRSRV